MNLHEYQAKQLFAENNIPVPEHKVATTLDEALSLYQELGGGRVVIKAQVHAGGRGKAGGVRVVDNKPDLAEAVKQLLGSRLVTHQTDAAGQPVNHIMLEMPAIIEHEYYLSAVVDRHDQKIVFMASTEGGMDIEQVAEETPEKILTFTVDPLVGVMPYQCREMAYKLGLKGTQVRQFTHIVMQMSKMFHDLDLSLVEVNPLVVNDQAQLVCLDGKINIDENALYRQQKVRDMRDPAQEDERENRAKQSELNYISLDGNIGCMVNGAGLAMATMDLIQYCGGKPANFLDVGGGATKDRVAEAFKIIISDENVKAILVNIFGGIVRCDLIADGILGALADVDVSIPVIVRLEGNNAEQGRKKLSKSGLNVLGVNNFKEAAMESVRLANDKKGE